MRTAMGSPGGRGQNLLGSMGAEVLRKRYQISRPIPLIYKASCVFANGGGSCEHEWSQAKWTKLWITSNITKHS
jgi:hypothetical protein